MPFPGVKLEGEYLYRCDSGSEWKKKKKPNGEGATKGPKNNAGQKAPRREGEN